MRLLTFAVDDRVTYGEYRNGEIIELQVPGLTAPDLIGVVGEPVQLAEARQHKRLNTYSASTVRYLPPITNPAKIICVGINYRDHAVEASLTAPRTDLPGPPIFARFADTLVGHKDHLMRPAVSNELDWEGELAIVIGRPGRYIARADAFDHVAGYSCFNDASVRDFQRHTSQWLPGKVFPATGGFGPWIVTPDEAGDLRALTIETRVNGHVMQHAALSDMIFDVAGLISYISSFTPLAPGDVICSGTPSGVGAFRDPPVFLEKGDVVEVEISGIGQLENTVEQEQPMFIGAARMPSPTT